MHLYKCSNLIIVCTVFHNDILHKIIHTLLLYYLFLHFKKQELNCEQRDRYATYLLLTVIIHRRERKRERESDEERERKIERERKGLEAKIN